MTVIPAHELVQTRDCATAGCTNEADGPDGRCSYCRAFPPRRELSAAERRSLFRDDEPARSFTPTPRLRALADELAPDPKEPPPVRTCKIDGCDQPPLTQKSLYAGLCATHREQARAARNGPKAPASEGAPSSAPQPPAALPAQAAEAGPREAPPGGLTKLAARVDTTAYELARAREAHIAALQALRAAIDEQAA